MSDVNTLSIPIRVACSITGADPQLVSECDGTLERRRVMRHAVAFILTFAVAACLWSAVLSLLLPRWAAVLGGLFAGAIVYLLDLSISTADWDLKGVLAEPMTASLRSFKLTLARWVKVIVRLGLALVLAMVTGTYVTLWLFNETIEMHLHEQRMAYNAPIEAEYRAATESLRRELFGPHLADRSSVVYERAELLKRVQQSQAELIDAEQAATSALIEMHREETGLGERAAGRGPKYRDAQLHAEAANRRLTHAEQTLDRDRVRLVEIEDRIGATDARMREADGPFQSRVALLEAERDTKLRPTKSDFLMRFQALNEIKANAIEVSLVAYATKAVIVIFEMIFFVVFLNDHASVYTVRLIARTKLEARRVDKEFTRAMRQIEGVDMGDSRVNPGVQPGRESHEPTVDHCDVLEQSLFDSAAHSLPKQFEPETTPAPDTAQPAEVSPESFSVIGGEPGELVTTAEALADRDRYWVNPDRADEIWDRNHRNKLVDPGYDNAA